MAQRHVCASVEDLITKVVAAGSREVWSAIVETSCDAVGERAGNAIFEVIVTADFGANDVLHYGFSAPQNVDDARLWAVAALAQVRALVGKAGLTSKGGVVYFDDERPSRALTVSPGS